MKVKESVIIITLVKWGRVVISFAAMRSRPEKTVPTGCCCKCLFLVVGD
jgi:hypothetical protein